MVNGAIANPTFSAENAVLNTKLLILKTGKPTLPGDVTEKG